MSLFSWWNKREGQHNLECSLASLLRGDILALGVYIVGCVYCWMCYLVANYLTLYWSFVMNYILLIVFSK